MIVWTERFSVGLKKIDDQHQQLFAMINDLIQLRQDASGGVVVADVLGRMTEYTDYHFKTEERVMMEYGYPDYPLQVREHAGFKAKAASFCVDPAAGKTDLSAEMLGYLQNWLLNHILESDLRFRDFLIENGFLPNGKAHSPTSKVRNGCAAAQS
jgi:hemerythrin